MAPVIFWNEERITVMRYLITQSELNLKEIAKIFGVQSENLRPIMNKHRIKIPRHKWDRQLRENQNGK